MQRLPELRPTPVRGRHPLVYGSTFLLFVSLLIFLRGKGMLWAMITAGLAILMAVMAFIIALKGPRSSA